MFFNKKYSILSNLIKIQIFAILFSFTFLFVFFFFIRKSLISTEINKKLVKVRNSLSEDQERLRAWSYMGMEEAVDQTTAEIKKRKGLEDIRVGPRSSFTHLLSETSFLLPEKSDHMLGEDIVLFVVLKKDNVGFWDYFDTYSLWFLFVLAIAFTLIVLFSAEYIRRNIFYPIRDLVSQLEGGGHSTNTYLSAIPARGEVAMFIDKVTQIYNSSKIKEKEEARFKLAKQVAHDIKSPLLALDVAMENIGSVDDTSRLLIGDAITRIKDIANNLLSVKGEKRQKSDILLLMSEIERAVSEKRTLFKKLDKLSFSINNCTKAGDIVFIEMNASKLQRSISNIINNAVEAMNEEGKVEISIHLVGENIVKIQISDTGSGIPQNKIELIQRQGYSFNKVGGHGLGLSYAVSAFDEVGAKLSVASIEGKGTDVIVEIPVVKPPSYFYTKLELSNNSKCVFVDDYENILSIWKDLISKNFSEEVLKNCVFFNSLEDFQSWMELGQWDNATRFFIDYHFTRDSIKGTDVIGNYPILENTVLVTSQYDNPKLIKKVKELGIKILPKQLQKKIEFCYLGDSQSLNQNQKFYENVADNWLESLSKEKGLNTCVDLENIQGVLNRRLLTGNERILEIGFGRLRVVDWLSRNFPNRLNAIDFCEKYYNLANKKYSNSHQVEFHLGSVTDYNFKDNYFDVVLWMWSGLYELDEVSRDKALKNLHKQMVANSIFVVDLAIEFKGSEIIQESSQLVYQVSDGWSCQNVIKSREAIIASINRRGFVLEEEIAYNSEVSNKRLSLVFRKIEGVGQIDERQKNISTSLC